MIKDIPQPSNFPYLSGRLHNGRRERAPRFQVSLSGPLVAQVLTTMAYAHFDGCFAYISTVKPI